MNILKKSWRARLLLGVSLLLLAIWWFSNDRSYVTHFSDVSGIDLSRNSEILLDNSKTEYSWTFISQLDRSDIESHLESGLFQRVGRENKEYPLMVRMEFFDPARRPKLQEDSWIYTGRNDYNKWEIVIDEERAKLWGLFLFEDSSGDPP